VNKYEVEIDGKLYRVTIEEISEGERSEPKNNPRKNEEQNKTVQKSEPAPSTPSSNSGNGQKVTAPMPGNVLKVAVKEGQSVQKGDMVMILEAMKMENEIVAPADGTVSAIHVAEGQSVESDDVLFEI